MSKLQEALDWTEKAPVSPHVAILAKYARRVANPDIDSATAITYQLRYIQDGDDWDDKIEDITAEAVNVALGIKEKEAI